MGRAFGSSTRLAASAERSRVSQDRKPCSFSLTIVRKARKVTLQKMTEYLVTKQGAYADWGSNAEGEIQEMPLAKPDGAGWRLHSVLPTQYYVMAVWERETPAKTTPAKASSGSKRR